MIKHNIFCFSAKSKDRRSCGSILLFALLIVSTPVFLMAEEPKTAKAALQLEIALVTVTQENQNEVNVDGVVEAVRAATVSSQVAGRITELAVAAGDRVSSGQLLLKLESGTIEKNLQAAKQRLQSATALLNVAKADYQQFAKLREKKFVSGAEFTRMEGAYQSALAEKLAREADVDALSSQLGLFSVRAPFNGLVAHLSAQRGDMAMPGVDLLTLHDPSELRVRVAVPESHAASLKQLSLNSILINIEGFQNLRPNKILVLPEVDALSRTVVVELALPAETKNQEIIPGTFATIQYRLPDLLTGKIDGIEFVRIWVPVSAVVERAELTGVYIVDADGSPQLRYARLGPRRGDLVEILSGVGIGDSVLINPDTAFANIKANAR